jgi:hypothetical protein
VIDNELEKYRLQQLFEIDGLLLHGKTACSPKLAVAFCLPPQRTAPNDARMKRSATPSAAAAENAKQQKASSGVPDATKQRYSTSSSRFGDVLAAVSSLVLEYLPPEAILPLVVVCPSAFSPEVVHAESVKAINVFANANVTRIGRQCRCDWLRRLDFIPRDIPCGTVPGRNFRVKESLLAFHVLGGARALLDALMLTKSLRDSARETSKSLGGAMDFVPLICPLLLKKKVSRCTEKELTKAMNRICDGSGSRYFREAPAKQGIESLNRHWDEIRDSSCRYCDGLTTSTKTISESRSKKVKRIRSTCQKVYQPLKTTMMKTLQFVRFVSRPVGLNCAWARGTESEPYDGLVVGITEEGVLCGLYLRY